MQLFVNLSIMFWLYTALQYRSNYYVEFFLCKLSKFDVELIINNFRDRFICNFRGFSKQTLEMLYSFFLAGSF